MCGKICGSEEDLLVPGDIEIQCVSLRFHLRHSGKREENEENPVDNVNYLDFSRF